MLLVLPLVITFSETDMYKRDVLTFRPCKIAWFVENPTQLPVNLKNENNFASYSALVVRSKKYRSRFRVRQTLFSNINTR